jgi:hypothetical protein
MDTFLEEYRISNFSEGNQTSNSFNEILQTKYQKYEEEVKNHLLNSLKPDDFNCFVINNYDNGNDDSCFEEIVNYATDRKLRFRRLESAVYHFRKYYNEKHGWANSTTCSPTTFIVEANEIIEKCCKDKDKEIHKEGYSFEYLISIKNVYYFAAVNKKPEPHCTGCPIYLFKSFLIISPLFMVGF